MTKHIQHPIGLIIDKPLAYLLMRLSAQEAMAAEPLASLGGHTSMIKYRPAPGLEGQEVEIKSSHEHASLANPHYRVWKVSFPFGDKLYYDWEYDVLSLKGEFLGVAWERMMLKARHPEYSLIAT